MKCSITKKQKIIGIALIALLLIGAVLFAALRLTANSKTTLAAFYGLDEKTQSALKMQIEKLAADAQGRKLSRFIILDASQTLKPQIKRNIDLIFAPAGINTELFAPNTSPPETSLFRRMPQAMGKAGMNDQGLAYAVPILLDHFEAAYNIRLLSDWKKDAPLSLPELSALALSIKTKDSYPIFCPGGIDRELLLLVSALTEASFGEAGLRALIQLIKTEPDFSLLVSAPLAQSGGSLADALQNLVDWQKKALIHPEWFRAGKKDAEAFIEYYPTGIILMSLSFHRTIPLNLIRQFSSTWFPVNANLRDRSLIVPAVLGIVCGGKNKQKTEKLQSIISNLVSENVQTDLSIAAELAPVHSVAETQDKQAADVRLWAASSNSLLPSIETAAFTKSTDAAAFAEKLRVWLRSQNSAQL